MLQSRDSSPAGGSALQMECAYGYYIIPKNKMTGNYVAKPEILRLYHLHENAEKVKGFINAEGIHARATSTQTHVGKRIP